LVAGNQVTFLIDGPATYAAMLETIRNATDHINLETYIFEDDDVGHRFADLLLKKQSEGVQVNLIYDSVGCLNTPAAFFQRLREGGVQTLEFNPINPLKVDKGRFLTHRDHRKILIVDGSIAFTGGVNISRVYSSSSRSLEHREGNVEQAWRDTHVQIEGPSLQNSRNCFWTLGQGEKDRTSPNETTFPELKQEGERWWRSSAARPARRTGSPRCMYLHSFTLKGSFT